MKGIGTSRRLTSATAASAVLRRAGGGDGNFAVLSRRRLRHCRRRRRHRLRPPSADEDGRVFLPWAAAADDALSHLTFFVRAPSPSLFPL